MISNQSSSTVTIIKDKLYWISDKNPPPKNSNAFFFNVDNDLVYEPFFADFGPLDLGKTYRFVTELDKLMKDPKHSKSKFYHHTSVDSAKRANAAYLMGAYQIIFLERTADEAWSPFANIQPNFVHFRDASYTSCSYKCTILDCLRGLELGIRLKWFDVRTFNLMDYEYYEKVENGDLNWIIPGKFLAFSGPSASQRDPDGYRRFTPEDYVPIFKKNNVSLVVRLNSKQYEKKRFTQHGIKHVDFYFLDGSCPSDEVVNNFLSTVEQEKGAVAVHCKAGLGRTGTLIGAYALKHFKFPAADFIGWIRLCRPGSILGPQQQFLCDIEAYFHKQAKNSPIYQSLSPKMQKFLDKKGAGGEEIVAEVENFSLVPSRQRMSEQEENIAKFGDKEQANRLLSVKLKARPIQETINNDSMGEIPSEDNTPVGTVPCENEFMFRGGKIGEKIASRGGFGGMVSPFPSRFKNQICQSVGS